MNFTVLYINRLGKRCYMCVCVCVCEINPGTCDYCKVIQWLNKKLIWQMYSNSFILFAILKNNFTVNLLKISHSSQILSDKIRNIFIIFGSKYKNIIKYKNVLFQFSIFVFFLLFNFLFSFSLMPSSHCTIFHSPTGFAKSPTNGRNLRQIGARSREWQSRSVNYQRRDLRESVSELSAILNPAVWMSSDWNIHRRWPTANERARYRAAGSSGRTFFSFFLLSNYLCTNNVAISVHFCIRIYRTGTRR